MRRVVKRLEAAKIPYAIVGEMVVNFHNYRRTTGEVDLLLTPEGFAEFRRRFVPRNYASLPRRDRRFTDRASKVNLDILVSGFFPGTGKPGPIAYPDPNQVFVDIDGIRVVDLPTLIQLKLAARRYRDFGDVVELIRFNELDELFAGRLHPTLRRDYTECLEEKRREDEYEARQ